MAISQSCNLGLASCSIRMCWLCNSVYLIGIQDSLVLLLWLDLGLGYSSECQKRKTHHFAKDVSILVHNNIYVIVAEIDYIWLFLKRDWNKSAGETRQFVIKGKMST